MWPKHPLVVVAAKYGLLASLFGFAFLLILYAMGRHPFLIPVFFDFRIILLGFAIFFALRELRERHFSGLLYFWQGMIASMLLTLIFACLTALAIWVYATLRPSFIDEYVQLFREQVAAFPADVIEKIGKENVDRNLKAIAATKPTDLAVLYAWQSGLISLFVSIILAVILRRQPKLN
jgi:hypothetical protein